jgi:acetyl esterase
MLLRIFKLLVLALAAAIAVFAYMVYQKAETGHGKLDARVALFLTLGELMSDGPEKLDPASVVERREAGIRSALDLIGEVAEIHSVEQRNIPGPGGDLAVRVYTPRDSQTPLPAVVYYHGGGWSGMSLDTHDNICRKLAQKADAIVVSVDWRRAPEHPFPAGLNDAYAALEWVAQNAESIAADPMQLAVAGDSSGGNFAAVVAHMARDRQGPVLQHQLLIYPATDASDLSKRSYQYFEEGYGLSKRAVEYYIDMYISEPEDKLNPLVSPLLAEDFKGLPSATILTAEVDVLNSDADMYQARLQAAGVAVKRHTVKGMIHGFVGADKLLPGPSEEALAFMANGLREAFVAAK